MEPPDPFPNSEVKRLSADGSVVRPCESRSSSAPYLKPPLSRDEGGFGLGVAYIYRLATKYLSTIAKLLLMQLIYSV